MARAFQTLTTDLIVEINRQLIRRFGGTFSEGDRNLLNPGSLEYILQAIRGSLFGRELYHTVIEKAAAVGWTIIAKHVFHDGNKRTGMEACRMILEKNGYRMRMGREVIDAALAAATNSMDLSEFTLWVKTRSVITIGAEDT